MRAGLLIALAVSLGAHVAVVAALRMPRGAEADPLSVDPSPRLAGETFELPAPEAEDLPLANASPSPETTAASDPAADGDAPARPLPPARGARVAARPSHPGRPSGGRAAAGEKGESSTEASGPPALYGAVGERSASDIATAFTRAFADAASGDAAWRTAAFGSAGEVDLILTIDDAGHLESSKVLGAPTPALSSAIRRTLALIKSRPFVAKGRTTKLRISSTVSADTVHDGLHGEVFAVGGSYAGGEGSAFFALAIGRRVDVRVRLR